MSYNSQALGSFCPTTPVLRPLFLLYQATRSRLGQLSTRLVSSRPLLSALVVPARQAYSHCASVGNAQRNPSGNEEPRRSFTFSQKATASSQLTIVTGQSSS